MSKDFGLGLFATVLGAIVLMTPQPGWCFGLIWVGGAFIGRQMGRAKK